MFRAYSLFLLSLGGTVCLAMDHARVETRVDAAVAAFGVSGRGVIVAIMDRGIDWRNNDFRNPDGSTRIAAMFDLTDDAGAQAPENHFGKGSLYSREQIDEALRTRTNLATRDALGHGTTTAGIAAGNGRNRPQYRGIAPAATLIVIKIGAEDVPAHDDQPAESSFFDLGRVPLAMRFVREQAALLRMPAVMLLNLGSVAGPMDGTSTFCRTLDDMVGPGIPGLVFVTGSSDDGGIANHAGGNVGDGESVQLEIHKGNAGPLYCDLWYSTNDQFDVIIETPTRTYGPYTSPGLSFDYTQETTAEFGYYHSSGGYNYYAPASGQREIYLTLFGELGDYRVILSGASVVSGHFNAWLNPSRFWAENTRSNYFTSMVVPGRTIWDMGTAKHNICPNDYVGRTHWVDLDGIPRSLTDQGDLGDLWAGTGIGPTADGRIGIDVSAPGDSVFAVYNTNSYWATLRHNLIQDGGGLYGRAAATSAANPIMTGIIALMLEANPSLDAAQVKRILQDTARADNFTGPTPNVRWGHGKVDAYAALSAVRETLPMLNLSRVSGVATIAVRRAMAGVHYHLEASGDLVTWSTVAEVVAKQSEFAVVEPLAISGGSQFYRLRAQ